MPTAFQVCLSCRARAAQRRGLCMACYNCLGIAALEAHGRALAPQKARDAWMRGFRIKSGQGPPPVTTEEPTP